MSMRRIARLGLGARGLAAPDDSDNFKVAVSCQEGDEPTIVLASVTTAVGNPTAAQAGGRARLVISVRKNIDQDVPNGFANDTLGGDPQIGGEIVADLEVGVTQAAASPHIIPLDGIEMGEGDALVVEGGKILDNTGAGVQAMWGISVMGRRRRQRKDVTR